MVLSDLTADAMTPNKCLEYREIINTRPADARHVTEIQLDAGA